MLNQIKSNSFMGWAAIFTVLFLAPNTYFVYHNFSVFTSPWREIASVGVALIIASGILIYTIRKNFKVAKYYTLFEVSISAYYYISTIGWDWGLIPALGFTLILPISVYYYSREFDNDGEQSDNWYDHINEEDWYNLNIEYSNIKNKCIELDKLLSESQSEIAHWISEYERAVQGWTNDVSLRDERISELTALNLDTVTQRNELAERVEYLDEIINDRDHTIQNVLHPKISHLEKQLSELYDKYNSAETQVTNQMNEIDLLKRELSMHVEPDLPTRNPIDTTLPDDAMPEPPKYNKPLKPKAPAKTRNKSDRKNTE